MMGKFILNGSGRDHKEADGDRSTDEPIDLCLHEDGHVLQAGRRGNAQEANEKEISQHNGNVTGLPQERNRDTRRVEDWVF